MEKSFREPNFKKMKELMKKPLIFDGRNIYTTADIVELGFEYIRRETFVKAALVTGAAGFLGSHSLKSF